MIGMRGLANKVWDGSTTKWQIYRKRRTSLKTFSVLKTLREKNTTDKGKKSIAGKGISREEI